MSQSRRRARSVYATVYKSVYLMGVLLNLILLVMDSPNVMLSSYVICVVVFATNLVAWVAYSRGLFVGQIAELALSMGRMIMIAIISSVLLASLAILSPLEAVLWTPLFVFADGHVSILWAFCLTLLSLEIVYFLRVLKVRPEPAKTACLTEQA